MIGAVVNAEFLPTSTEFFTMPDSPLGVLMITIAIFTGLLTLTYFLDEEWPATLLMALVTVILAGIPLGVQYIGNLNESKENIVKNVKTVYDVDEVMLGDWSEKNPKATIIKTGKAHEVILTENNETFEPMLSTLNDDSFDVEKLKRLR
jgi:hypothetical protein